MLAPHDACVKKHLVHREGFAWNLWAALLDPRTMGANAIQHFLS